MSVKSPALLAFDHAARTQLRPILRKAGFTRFDGRTAWRHGEHWVDVVSLYAVAGDAALAVAPAVEFGFSVARYNPAEELSAVKVRVQNGKPFPRNCHCQRQMSMCIKAHRIARQTWHINAAGSNAASAVRAAIEFIVIDGLAWLARLETTGACSFDCRACGDLGTSRPL